MPAAPRARTAIWSSPSARTSTLEGPTAGATSMFIVSETGFRSYVFADDFCASSDQGQFVDATVVDLCPGCASGSIDLSTGAFEQLAPISVGRLQVSWDFE